jgi:hypothetical protein
MSSSEDNRGLDLIKLAALSRIPRCLDCPRHKTLLARVESGGPSQAPLPSVPVGCNHLHCAPIAARYARNDEQLGLLPFDNALAC